MKTLEPQARQPRPRRHRRPAAKPDKRGAISLAEALDTLSRRIGIGGPHVPSGLEVLAESIRDGFGQLATSIERLADVLEQRS